MTASTTFLAARRVISNGNAADELPHVQNSHRSALVFRMAVLISAGVGVKPNKHTVTALTEKATLLRL
jgi:hypothetical protein